MSNFGGELNQTYSQKRVGKKVQRIKTGYEFSYNKDVFNVIYFKIINDKEKYDPEFVNFVNNFDTYYEYLCIK